MLKKCRDDGDILGMSIPKRIKTTHERPLYSSNKTPLEKTPVVVDEKKNIPVGDPGWVIDVDKLTEDQFRRYEVWKRSVLPQKCIADMISPYSSVKFDDIHVSMVSACAKMLVGDLVENARMHRGSTGPIKPGEIQDAADRVLTKRRILPDYCPILKRRNYRIPIPEKVDDFWSMF